MLSLVEKRPSQGSVPPEDAKRERRRLKKIYKELARRCDQPSLGIDLMEFLKFTELPGLLGEQFFKALDVDGDERLDLEEFTSGFLMLYKGSREEISQMLFTVLDFTHKGYITLRDMRCVLPYLPGSCPKCGKRVVHQWKMEEKIAMCFARHEILRFEHVIDLMSNHQDLFNAILDALLSSLPAIFDEAMKRFHRQSCEDGPCKEASGTPRRTYELKSLKLSGRRYLFDLRNQALYYYISVDNSSPKGIILIKDLFVSPIGELGFELKNIKFSYQFESNSRAERDDWIQRIQQENNYRWFDDLYETRELVGSGAYGQVYKAVNKSTSLSVAVKIVSKETMDVKAESRLRRELGILKFAHHRNLLEMYEVFETCEMIYIVTEFIDGGTLFEFLEEKGFKVAEDVAKKIVFDVASGLSFLHENGIIHRDLKLENIMLKHEGKTFRAILIDYGLSCFLGPEQVSNEPVGTLKYVAPEIISRLTYREKVDSWSLGVILYIMLQGTVPFYGKNDQDVALRILKRHINFSGERWSEISHEAVSVVSGLLNRKAERRMALSEILSSDWFNNERETDSAEEDSTGIEVPLSFGLSTPFQGAKVA